MSLLLALAAGCALAASPSWKNQYAEVNGVRLHYVTQGKGPLIIFLHGFPEFWYEWKDQLPEFGKDHRAVAPDMRGYNLSEKPVGVDRYQMKDLVEDVRALAEHLGYKKFILVGHDWGGGVAWSFAIAHPEYLEKLIIVNCPHPAVLARELAENPAQQKASQYMLLFRSPQAEQTLSANNYAALVDGVLGDGLKSGVFTDADKQAYIEAWSRPGALTGGLNYYRAANLGPPTPGTSAPPLRRCCQHDGEGSDARDLGRKRHRAADRELGRHGQVCPQSDRQAHSGRVALGDPRKARVGEWVHSRVHSIARVD